MGKKIGIVWNILARYKYVIVIVVGIVVVGFVDDNSFVQRVKYDMEIEDLKEQIAQYNKVHEKDAKALKHNPRAIEKIAREKYFMKTDDEDVFVLSDDIQFTEDRNDETAK